MPLMAVLSLTSVNMKQEHLPSGFVVGSKYTYKFCFFVYTKKINSVRVWGYVISSFWHLLYKNVFVLKMCEYFSILVESMFSSVYQSILLCKTLVANWHIPYVLLVYF
jgi:hypothetical protein